MRNDPSRHSRCAGRFRLSLLLALAFWMERTLHRAAREDADFWAERAFKLDADLRKAKGGEP